MKRGFAFGVIIVSLVGSCARAHDSEKERKEAPTAKANEQDPWKQQAPKKDPLKAPLLWEAEKDGKRTYFLGTMHMGIEPETRLPQIVWDKLDAAKSFAMEADLSDPGLGTAMLRTSGSLHQELGDAYWKKLEAVVGKATAAQLDRMQPMGAAAMMALKDLPRTSPMDGVLQGRAINKGKPIVYLEEAMLQIRVLQKHLDLRSLKLMIDTADHGAKQSKQMLDAYIAGDPNGILAVNDAQKDDALKSGYTQAEYDEQMNDILYNRNASWIEKLEKMHEGGGGFVAVGALHLIGPKSVLELLEKKGFKITRVKPI